MSLREVEHETKLISVKQMILKSNTFKRAAVEKQIQIDECLKGKKRLVERRTNCEYLLIIDIIYKNDVQ